MGLSDAAAARDWHLRPRPAPSGRSRGRDADALLLATLLRPLDARARGAAGELLGRWGSLPALLSAPRHMIAATAGGEAADALSAVREAGLTMIRAEIEDRALLGTPRSLVDYVRARIGHLRHEEAWAIFLDGGNRAVGEERVGIGSHGRLSLRPGMILRHALAYGAASIILVHNHPGGDPTPSDADVATTHELRLLAAALEMDVTDHIVMSRSSWTSMRAEGLL